jgi:hypothetical protein
VEIPELLTVRQAAEILKLSTDSVSRKFADLPGVINLGSEESFSKRRYNVLRIPRSVLERFINAHKVR